jgi:hypothetical protein
MQNVVGKLTGEALRNAAQSLFKGFYERGLSANAALKSLREAGLGYRRQDFLKDYAKGQSSTKQAQRIRYVAGKNVPSEKILEPHYFGVPDKYSLLYRADVTDAASGEKKQRYFFQHRNSLEDRASMEEEAQSWYNSTDSNYPEEAENITLVEGYINAAWA